MSVSGTTTYYSSVAESTMMDTQDSYCSSSEGSDSYYNMSSCASSSTSTLLLLSDTSSSSSSSIGSNGVRLLPFSDATTGMSILALCVLMITIRYSRSCIFEPVLYQLGKRLGKFSHGPEWVHEHPEQMENFRSFSYRLLFRCIVCGLGLYEFYHNPSYWYDTQQLWEGYPHHVCSNAVQIVYLLQLAYHLEDLGSAIVQGNARKRADFAAMVVHHIVTSLLLIGSSHLKTHRIGVIVSTLHAVTDVPKDFTQVAKQLEWRYCKLAGFVTLLATWIAARVILYPFKYVWSVFAESRQFLVHAEGGMSDTALNIFMTLLSVLVLLNTMWCHMLIKLVIRVLKEGDTSTADPTMSKDESAPATSQEDDDNDDTKKNIGNGVSHSDESQDHEHISVSDTSSTCCSSSSHCSSDDTPSEEEDGEDEQS